MKMKLYVLHPLKRFCISKFRLLHFITYGPLFLNPTAIPVPVIKHLDLTVVQLKSKGYCISVLITLDFLCCLNKYSNAYF